MLYVIETHHDGRVAGVRPCPDGIDEAIDYIAGQLTGPEEDWTASCDVLSGQWNDLVAETPVGEPVPYENALFTRPRFPLRFGLAVVA